MQRSYNLGPSQCETNLVNFLQVREIICKYKAANSKIMLLKTSKDQFALYYCADYLKRYRN